MQKSLCNSCKFLFRRVFRDPEVDDEGTLIAKTCLITQWDLDNSETHICSHYETKIEYNPFERLGLRI